MVLAPLCHSLAVCACLLLALPAWGADDEPAERLAPPAPVATPAAGSQAEAKALVDAGRFAAALVLLHPLLEERPVEGNTLFLYGLAAAGASQQPGLAEEDRDALLDAAIGAFHAMLVEAPGLVRVRLEDRRGYRWGRTHSEIGYHGGKVKVARPRVRDRARLTL